MHALRGESVHSCLQNTTRNCVSLEFRVWGKGKNGTRDEAGEVSRGDTM